MQYKIVCLGLVLISNAVCSGSFGIEEFNRDGNRLNAGSNSLSESEIRRLVNDSSAVKTEKRISISAILENTDRDRYYYYPRKSASEIEFKWISDSLVKSEISDVSNATWIKSLPAALIPNGSGFDHYRDAAARMKSNELLLYKVDANIYENYKLFGKNTVMAISTIDFILLNVAEGSIINSVVVSKKVKIQQNENESSDETIFRAKSMAILESLKEGVRMIKPSL